MAALTSYQFIFLCGTLTDSQQNDEEPGGVKRTKTVDSSQEQQGNAQEKSNKEQHSCKTGHLSKLTEINENV